MNPLLILAVVLLFLIYLYKCAFSRPPNFPPGPPSLPIYGAYWLLLLSNFKLMHKAIDAWSKRYKTKIIGFYLGDVPSVIVSDYNLIKEVETRPEFVGRMDTIVARERGLGKLLGIILADGPLWAHQRRYTLRYMRDFGFGTRSETLEALMEQEIQDVIDVLNNKKKDEGVFKDGIAVVPTLFQHILMNAIWSMYAGEKFSYKNHEYARFIAKQSMDFVNAAEPTGGTLVLTPWIRHLFPGMSGYKKVKETNQKIIEVIKKTIEEHKRTYSEDHTRDFIDMYLKEIKNDQNNPDGTPFTEEQLLFLGWDLLVSAITTITSTLGIYVQYLINHPEVQLKIQKEIDNVVGRDRLPHLNDRQNMPYMEAVSREAFRIISLFGLGIAHRAVEDTTLGGYSIPKNSMVMTGLYSYHHDPDVWGDPEVFRPERFLDDSGHLNKKDPTLPFGAGKRVCAGETFARQNMWLILTGLLQNFTLVPVKGNNLSKIETLTGLHQVSPDVHFRPIPRCS